MLQVFSFAVLPQALPLMISYTLLDFESNVRSATILGIVGAGGIGFELQASFSQFQFQQVMTILIEIVLLVTLIDQLSAYVRAALALRRGQARSPAPTGRICISMRRDPTWLPRPIALAEDGC